MKTFLIYCFVIFIVSQTFPIFAAYFAPKPGNHKSTHGSALYFKTYGGLSFPKLFVKEKLFDIKENSLDFKGLNYAFSVGVENFNLLRGELFIEGSNNYDKLNNSTLNFSTINLGTRLSFFTQGYNFNIIYSLITGFSSGKILSGNIEKNFQGYFIGPGLEIEFVITRQLSFNVMYDLLFNSYPSITEKSFDFQNMNHNIMIGITFWTSRFS